MQLPSDRTFNETFLIFTSAEVLGKTMYVSRGTTLTEQNQTEQSAVIVDGFGNGGNQ